MEGNESRSKNAQNAAKALESNLRFLPSKRIQILARFLPKKRHPPCRVECKSGDESAEGYSTSFATGSESHHVKPAKEALLGLNPYTDSSELSTRIWW